MSAGCSWMGGVISDLDEPDAEPPGPAAVPRHLAVTQQTAVGEARVHAWPAVDDAALRPVLVCLHGWTASGEAFGPLATALGRRWTVLAPDAPGHGGTPWPGGARYRIAEHADTALAVLDRLPEVAGRRAGVVLLGHSMGALTAARLAAARPDVVRHLVLTEPARTAVRHRPPSAARKRADIAGLQALDDESLATRADPRWPADEVAGWARAKRQMSLPALSVPVDWGEPLIALLADVPVPVTLIRGRTDRGGIVSAVAARRCAAACRAGCELVSLDAGHHPQREARTPFVAVLAHVLGHYGR